MKKINKPSSLQSVKLAAMKLKILSILPALLLWASCSNQQQGEQSEESSACTYEYQSAYTTVKWTAYKFTEKLGVGGAFDEFEVTPGAENSSISGLLDGLSFNIQTSSTNTANPERDQKIMQYFFGELNNNNQIEGRITELSMNDSTGGTAQIELKMNNATKSIPAEVLLEGNEVVLKAEINVADWNAQHAIDSLNQVCYDLHKGADGISKLWPDVSIEVRSALKKNCPEVSGS